MLEYLEIENAGPADHLRLDLAPRLNLLTGDNGLGKSFLLDVAWWTVAQTWPSEINPKVLTGGAIEPRNASASEIKFRLHGKDHSATFDFYHYEWETGFSDPFLSRDIIIYARPDQSFCILDRMRDFQLPCYVFDNSEVWEGQSNPARKSVVCNGLIRDWTTWQRDNKDNFTKFKKVLETLSPTNTEKIEPGDIIRIIGDAREIPTVLTSYGKIPINQASAGFRRIISLAYMIVWAWQEHKLSLELRNLPLAENIILLIDELDVHLHPKWQRTIVKSLMEVMEVLAPEVKVQIIAATHSPLVMASVEPFFDPAQDAWFDLDLNHETGQVEVVKRSEHWYRRGDADAWLKSEAFDQKSGYALETEKLIERAGAALQTESLSQEKALEIDAELRRYLAESDPFLKRWEYIAEKKGWLRE